MDKGSLMCCDSWGRKELDTTERLNWTDALSNNNKEAEVEWFYEDLQDLLELTPKKDVPFIIGNYNAKVGSQDISGVTDKFGLRVRNEAGLRLIEFCKENELVIANTLFQQHKRWLYTWTSSDGQYQNYIDYIFSSQRWRNSIQSARTRPGADYGSDLELLIAIICGVSQGVGHNWVKFSLLLSAEHR